MRVAAFVLAGAVIAASCGGKLGDGDGGTDGGGDDVNVSGHCCPPSSQPACCMSFGGWTANSTCATACDGMPSPNDPGWHQSTDSHGCAIWVPPSNPTSICGAKPPPPEAGLACQPADVTAWAPQIDPPFYDHAGVCGTQLISDIFTACFSNTPNQSQCQTLMTQNPKCQACLITPRTAQTWGAFLALSNNTIELDVAGCLSDLGNTTCAQNESNAEQCESAACDQCQVTDTQSFNDYEQCIQTADATGCAKFVAAKCTGLDAGAYAQCFPPDAQTGWTSFAALFCGP